MNTMSNDKLEKVTGGTGVEYDNGQPVCPVCGAVGQMKIVSKTANSTTYQCMICNQLSTDTVPQKEEPITSCPICGATGAAFQIIRDNGSTVTYKCRLCGHETESVK